MKNRHRIPSNQRSSPNDGNNVPLPSSSSSSSLSPRTFSRSFQRQPLFIPWQHWFIPLVIVSCLFLVLMLRRWWGYIEEILYACYCGCCVRACKRLRKNCSTRNGSSSVISCLLCGGCCRRCCRSPSYIDIDDIYMHEIPPLIPNDPIRPKKVSTSVSSVSSLKSVSDETLSSSPSSTSTNRSRSKKRTIQPESIQQTIRIQPSITGTIHPKHNNEGPGAMPEKPLPSSSSSTSFSESVHDVQLAIPFSSPVSSSNCRNPRTTDNTASNEVSIVPDTLTPLPSYWLVYDPEYGVQLPHTLEKLRKKKQKKLSSGGGVTQQQQQAQAPNGTTANSTWNYLEDDLPD